MLIAEPLIELEECGPRCVPGSVSSLCVYLCVLFFQSVIVIPLAQSVIAVMTQDFVYVRRALRGPSVRSVCPAICGTMAANVSRTTKPLLRLCPPSQLFFPLSRLPPVLSLSRFSPLLCVILELWLEQCAAHAHDCSAAPTNADPLTRDNPIYGAGGCLIH